MAEEQNNSMSRFFTREKAAATTRVYLTDPATGKPTEDWLDIRSSLSEEFRSMRAENNQKVAMFAVTNPGDDARKQFVEEAVRELRVALVAGWSFPEPCTPDNVREFLKQCPQIEDIVENVADDTRRFFGSGRTN